MQGMNMQFGHLQMAMFQLGEPRAAWDVEVMTRTATYRVERPTSSVFASGAL